MLLERRCISNSLPELAYVHTSQILKQTMPSSADALQLPQIIASVTRTQYLCPLRPAARAVLTTALIVASWCPHCARPHSAEQDKRFVGADETSHAHRDFWWHECWTHCGHHLPSPSWCFSQPPALDYSYLLAVCAGETAWAEKIPGTCEPPLYRLAVRPSRENHSTTYLRSTK